MPHPPISSPHCDLSPPVELIHHFFIFVKLHVQNKSGKFSPCLQSGVGEFPPDVLPEWSLSNNQSFIEKKKSIGFHGDWGLVFLSMAPRLAVAPLALQRLPSALRLGGRPQAPPRSHIQAAVQGASLQQPLWAAGWGIRSLCPRGSLGEGIPPARITFVSTLQGLAPDRDGHPSSPWEVFSFFFGHSVRHVGS